MFNVSEVSDHGPSHVREVPDAPVYLPPVAGPITSSLSHDDEINDEWTAPHTAAAREVDVVAEPLRKPVTPAQANGLAHRKEAVEDILLRSAATPLKVAPQPDAAVTPRNMVEPDAVDVPPRNPEAAAADVVETARSGRPRYEAEHKAQVVSAMGRAELLAEQAEAVDHDHLVTCVGSAELTERVELTERAEPIERVELARIPERKQFTRLLTLAARTGVGKEWLDRDGISEPTDIPGLTHRVRAFLDVLAEHPFAPGNLPSLAAAADLRAIARCLGRLEHIIDAAARAKVLLLANALGVARVSVTGIPFPVVEVCDSRGVTVGADCYVYVRHECDSTARIDMAEVLSYRPGVFWPDSRSGGSTGERLAVRSATIEGSFSVSGHRIRGVQVGDGNRSHNTVRHEVTCASDTRWYLDHPDVLAALRRCHDPSLTESELIEARAELRTRIISAAARTDPTAIDPDWQRGIRRQPVPEVNVSKGRILVVNATGAAIGMRNEVNGDVRLRRCRVVVL